MKRLAVVTLLAVGLLAGCSNGGSDNAKDSGSKSAESTTTVSSSKAETADKFADQQETGEGTLNIANVSGNTADGAEVTVMYDPDTFPTSVGMTTSGIDGSKTSYIYVDGQLVTKEQLGDTQTSVDLQDTPVAIEEGKHKLELVQYDNDSEDGNVVTFKAQEYTVKLK